MKQMSYSHLYTLNDVNDGLNNFDLSTFTPRLCNKYGG